MSMQPKGNAPTTNAQQIAALDVHVDVEASDNPSKCATHFEISNTTSNFSRGQKSGRHSIRILGQDVYTDERLQWRVQWAERCVGLFSFAAFVCYIVANSTTNPELYVVYGIMSSIALVCTGLLYYQNVSFAILK